MEARLVGLGHERAHDVVRGAEWHPSADERVGDSGGGRMALSGRRQHPARVDRDRLQQAGQHE